VFDLPLKGKAIFDLLAIDLVSDIAFVSSFTDRQESQFSFQMQIEAWQQLHHHSLHPIPILPHKKTAIFAEVKRYFGIVKVGWGCSRSLRTQHIKIWLDNQLERAVVKWGLLDESVVPVLNHLEYTVQIIFIWNKHINQLKDGLHFCKHNNLLPNRSSNHWDLKLQRTFNCRIVI
jgi:hypothetical protein